MDFFIELIHKDLKILSIKNFYKPSLFDTKRVNNILEENHKLYYLTQLDHYSKAAYNYPIIKNNYDLFFTKSYLGLSFGIVLNIATVFC